jgi:hypothetical protein
MAYVIQLVALECLRAQEMDGDEIYLKYNGAKIWQCAPDKMSAVLDHDNFVSHYDFVGGRKQTKKGWVAYQASTPIEWVESGEATFQLWEDDMIGDDMLGQTPVDATQASGGNISVVFQHEGAHYRLTYRVVA